MRLLDGKRDYLFTKGRVITMRFIGYSIFITKPGEYEELRCAVCGSICNVKRNVMGPRCYAEAVGKREGLHDKYECPHVEEDWHEECFDLSLELRETHSPTLKVIVRRDYFNSVLGHVDEKSIKWLEQEICGEMSSSADKNDSK